MLAAKEIAEAQEITEPDDQSQRQEEEKPNDDDVVAAEAEADKDKEEAEEAEDPEKKAAPVEEDNPAEPSKQVVEMPDRIFAEA